MSVRNRRCRGDVAALRCVKCAVAAIAALSPSLLWSGAVAKLFLDLPPVPLPGPRPLLGARANHLRFFANPALTMLRLHAKHGEIAALSRDDPSMVCAFGHRYNRQLLPTTGLFPNFAENPLRIPHGSAAAILGSSLIAQNGEIHRRNRRLMMPAFAKARLAGYGREIVDIAARTLEGWPREGVIDVKARSIELTLRVSMKCLFGLDLGAQARELGELSLAYLSLMTSPGAMLFPFALPGTPYTRFLRVCERLVERIDEVLERRRALGLDDDMLSALIASSDEDGGFSPNELVGQAAMLMTAGHETTAMTVSWTLLLLAAHPQIQLALGEDIAAQCGDRPPALDDLARLELLDRVVRESMRLLPATPMLFLRRSTVAFELGGHALPPGSTIVLSPLVTHRDPDLYPSPRRFDPDRWSGLEPGPYEYLPFGAGPRRCLGAGFATNAIRLVLASILQRVRVAIPAGARVDCGVSGIIMSPRGGLRLRVMSPDATLRPPRSVGGSVRELVALA
ncbi:Pentalenene oxygenase [Enhygromyxa salina]|uniref:Pentalenene oxygenase n=1 Tax=Enhygromyxa salina TaxID=215803 RepID=A0A2S9XEH9_9BACT|nr:cytochrome P450 [Enhygromyxa salina]PRP91265.1 Pentalenene oxygenase [Enhygromyxa salina]